MQGLDLSDDPCVEAWWGFDGAASGGLVLPDGSLDVVEEHGELRIVGPMTRAVWVPTTASVSGLRFRAGAVARWLRRDLAALRDRVVPARAFDALRAAGSLADVREIVSATAPLPEATHAAQLLRDAPELRIDELAHTLDVSERQLHRLFLAEIGLAPKVYARIQRLQRLAAWLVDESTGSLAAAAVDCGYTDQPHMNRDVTAFCGIAPGALRRALSDSFKTATRHA